MCGCVGCLPKAYNSYHSHSIAAQLGYVSPDAVAGGAYVIQQYAVLLAHNIGINYYVVLWRDVPSVLAPVLAPALGDVFHAVELRLQLPVSPELS